MITNVSRLPMERVRTCLIVSAMASAVLVPGAPGLPGAPAMAKPAPGLGVSCALARRYHFERQLNIRAAVVAARCGLAPRLAPPFTPPYPGTLSRHPSGTPASSAPAGVGHGTDVDVVTGTETLPNVTQSESMTWANGPTIVVNYNDSRDSGSGQYSGMSYSTDGGKTFTRPSPSPFATGHGSNLGDPIVVFDRKLGKWFAGDLAAGCGGQGIGLWTSATGTTWTAGACAHLGAADDRESMWVDNNPRSRYYGRLYISWNDFTLPYAAIVVAHSDNGVSWSTPVTVSTTATFIRNVQDTGSPGPDGTVFIAGMDEGGGLFANRQNYMYQSTDGGQTWTGGPIGAPFAAPGDLACNRYFVAIAPIWRYMGWGQPAVGPPGVVHYVYTAHGTVPADGGDIYYTRSTDNGRTWSTPVKLNTDTGPFPQWMPSLAATPSGKLVAGWYDRRNTSNGLDYEYWARVSTNGGATWSPDFRLSSQLIPQPAQPDPNAQLCYAGDYNYDTASATTAYLAWTDGRVAVDGVPQQDVFFNTVTP